jgi:hypothetical protein
MLPRRTFDMFSSSGKVAEGDSGQMENIYKDIQVRMAR